MPANTRSKLKAPDGYSALTMASPSVSRGIAPTSTATANDKVTALSTTITTQVPTHDTGSAPPIVKRKRVATYVRSSTRASSAANGKARVATADAPHSSHAAVTVFRTFELMENILRRVDMKTLLLSQRVDTNWRDIIINSKTLQRKLFLLPATSKDLPDLFEKPRLAQPSLRVIYRPSGWVILEQEAHNLWRLGRHWIPEMNSDMVAYNPLLLAPAEHWGIGGPLHMRPQKTSSSKNASWQKMLLFQPPLAQVQAIIAENNMHDRRKWERDFNFNGCVLLEPLLTAAEARVDSSVDLGNYRRGEKTTVLSRNGRLSNAFFEIAGEAVDVEQLQKLGL